MDSSFKPTQIGAYDVESVIARGGVTTIFKAMDRRAGRPVAIKVLTQATDDPDLLLLKFYRETKDIRGLQHQNIVTVYEVGYENGLPYLVTEYLEGEALDAIIAARRSMSVAEKLRIITQVCAGLSYAHKQDLVHRDIKPANILIVDNSAAKIADFGMARLGGNRVTETGQIVGNLNYMSPEQLNGNVELDHRTDIYSTGIVLFQLLTGVLPFEERTTAATLKEIEQNPPPPLGKYLKDCPEELEAIARKALAKNREDRYGSAEDFGADVARVQQQYEKRMLADYLQSAKELLARKDFPNAKQQALQVLRMAPQDPEADELLRLIKQGQEQQQRAQQALQLHGKAEEAFRRNEFAEALRLVDQGLQLDSGATVLLRLRDAVLAAREKIARYREAFQRAESALQSGDLESAKESIERALAIQPEDAQGRKLASQIRSRIEQQLREQESAQKSKKLASDIQTVERAMADARVRLAFGQVPEALRLLDGIQTLVSQVPPKFGEQVDLLKKEARAQQERSAEPSIPPRIEEPQTTWDRSADKPSPFDATSIIAPDVTDRHTPRLDEGEDANFFREQDVGLTPAGMEEPGLLSGPSPFEEMPENTPARPTRLEGRSPKRSVLWLSAAAVVLVAVVLWFALHPKPETSSQKPATPASASTYTYAEINAEPWATLRELTPVSGDAQKAIGLVTPLRVKLPAGEYNITLEGPNHERKQVAITVPLQGGANCFVLFRKPDLNRLLTRP